MLQSRVVEAEVVETPLPLRPPAPKGAEKPEEVIEVKAKPKLRAAGWRFSPWNIDWVADTLQSSEKWLRFSDIKNIRDGGTMWKLGIERANKNSPVARLFSNKEGRLSGELIPLEIVLGLFIRKSGDTLTIEESQTLFDYHLSNLWKAIFPKRPLGKTISIRGEDKRFLTEEEALDFLWTSLSALTQVKKLDLEITIKEGSFHLES